MPEFHGRDLHLVTKALWTPIPHMLPCDHLFDTIFWA